ncbi:MAG: sulfur carrier protein ThiS [Planctomycetota bacterium]|jgi:thiamine biosynthesis protein ThiS
MTSHDENVRIQVNGESREIAAGLNLVDLLDQLQVDQRQVAVERNREIVPKANYQETMLTDGDQLEIVTFVGGG